MDWETLRSSCLACTRCELCKTRTNVVFGQGVEDAEVLFVGDGPGHKEHGQLYEKGGILFMGTFHPAALLRSPQNKPAAFADFTALRDNIETVCKHTYHKD